MIADYLTAYIGVHDANFEVAPPTFDGGLPRDRAPHPVRLQRLQRHGDRLRTNDGITLPENFNWPYLARNLADFWQRWHISLSLWIRDYIYIPLGGNRFGIPRRIPTACSPSRSAGCGTGRHGIS